MGAEKDFFEGLVTQDFVDHVLRRNEIDRSEGHPRSPYMSYIDMLRQHTHEQMQQVMSFVDDGAVAISFDSEQIQQLNPASRGLLVLSYTGAFYSSIVPSLGRLIVDGQVDTSDIEAFFDRTVSGTMLPRIDLTTGSSVHEAPVAVVQKARDSAKLDKSLGIFFESPSLTNPNGAFDCLPKVIQSELRDRNMLSEIRKIFVPRSRQIFQMLEERRRG